MPTRRPNRRDLQASLFAAAATLMTVRLFGPDLHFEQLVVPAGDHHAMQGLIDAAQAESEGAWLLDEHRAEAKLSFAPEHERLVWRVDGDHAEVLIDAQTGEALEFVFE